MSDLDDFTQEADPPRLRIIGTWLVEESDECTGGACGLGYGHEPACGEEPIVDLSTVPGWGDLVAPLIEARVREAQAEAWADGFAAATDAVPEDVWFGPWSRTRNPYRDEESNA